MPMDSVVNINNVNNVNSVNNFNNGIIHWAKSRNAPNCHSSVSPIERLNIVIIIKDWQDKDVAKVPKKFHKLPIRHIKAIWKG